MGLLGLLAFLLVPEGLQPFGVFVSEAEGDALVTPIEVVVAHGADETGQATEIIGRSTTSADLATFLLGRDQRWVFRCVDPSRWCEPQVWEPGSSSAVRLVAWPKLTFHGDLRPADGATMPSSLVVQGWGLTTEGPLLSLHSVVAVEDDGSFSVEGPSTEFDLRFSAGEPWGPVYRWDLKSRSPRLDLGTLPLVAGASVSAFLVDGLSGGPLEGAEVSWHLEVEGVVYSPRERLRLANMRYATVSDPRGLAQIQGIAPGTYRLRASAEGRGVVELGPFQIDDAVEMHFEEILLEPLATLRVQVKPERDPNDRPWQITVRRDRSRIDDKEIIEVMKDGESTFQLPAGATYSVRLGSPETQDWIDHRTVEVEGEQLLVFEPPLIGVVGSVAMGDKPLEASIRIGGGRGKIKYFNSDEEGQFEGWMSWKPSEKFSVHVEPTEYSFKSEYSFPADEVEDILELDLILPDRSIAGRVLDAQGRPVEKVHVTGGAIDAGSMSRTWSGADGSYHLGLIPDGGPVHLFARKSNEGSVRVDVPEWGDGPGPTTDLVLSDLRTIAGVLISFSGAPLGGATISLKTSHFSTTKTLMDGSFEFKVNPRSRRGMLSVKAPGHVYWANCVQIPEEGPMSIRLPFPGPGGQLLVEYLGVEVPEGARLAVVTQGGGYLGISLLNQWALELKGSGFQDRSSGMIKVPHLAPGLYALAAGFPPSGGPDDGCRSNPPLLSDWVHVTQGGEATLKALAQTSE